MVPAEERRTIPSRRADDAMNYDIIAAIKELEDRMATLSQESRPVMIPWKQLAASVGIATTIVGAIIGTLTWLGSETIGPGAKLAAYNRAQHSSDSLAAIERQNIQKGLNSLNERTARLSYDVCVEVFRKPANACFADYRSDAEPVYTPTQR